MMILERRESLRYLMHRPVVVKTAGLHAASAITGELLDLNAHGARIASNSLLPCPAAIQLEIMDLLSPSPVLQLPARIEHVRGGARFHNYVLAFCQLSTSDSEKLQQFLAQESRISDRRLGRAAAQRANEKPAPKDRRLTKPLFIKCVRYNRIEQLKERNQYFYMREQHSGSAHRVVIKGREMINFSSNNYLGLTTHPEVKEAALRAIEKYGIGSGGSRILSGTMDLHNELERKLATFKGEEDCIVFNSGYHANVGVISSLLQKKDSVIIDAKCHASIIDGCFLSGANLAVFLHNDMRSLERELRGGDERRSCLVIADGVYSMDGDIARLDRIVELAGKYSAAVLLDDAHGLGVIGESGRGTAEHFGLEGQIDITIGTLSKALGSVGGFAVSKKKVIHYLKHNSRSFIFSTSLPPAALAAAMKALEIMEKEPRWIERLRSNIRLLSKELSDLGLETGPGCSAIIPIMIRDEMLTYRLTQKLEDDGIFVSPVAYPAVRRRESRLRLSLMATHSEDDLQILIDSLRRLRDEFPVISRSN